MSATGVFAVAVRLLAAPVLATAVLATADVTEAANPFMAEIDIIEYSGGKIQPAPDIALPALNGSTVSLPSLRGRPLLLVFWAST